MSDDDDPILVEVIRNGFTESVHRARVVVTAPDGSVELAAGPVDRPCYPRSSSKPMQAIGMLRAGLDLDGKLLALAGASHSGEDFHRDGVTRILAGCGLTAEDLRNTPDLPIDPTARTAWIRAGREPASIAQNCSGKHAAMLRTAVRLGADTTGYLDPGHPVQRACHEAIAELAGETPGDEAVDGCGAPLWSITPIGLARAFGRIAAAGDGPERALADAFRAHPTYASGTVRDEAALHAAVPGLVCKGGAEAVHAIGLADGRGIAIKIADGSARARAPLAAAVLQLIGVTGDGLEAMLAEPVLGHGEPVGEIRAITALTQVLRVR